MEKDIKEQLEKLQYYGEFYAKSDIDDKIKLEELDKTGEISEFGRNFSPQVDHKYTMVISDRRSYLLGNGRGGKDFENFLTTLEKLDNEKYLGLRESLETDPARYHIYTHRGDLLEAFDGVYDEELNTIGNNFGEVYEDVNEAIKRGGVDLTNYPDLERAFSDYELKLLDKEVWERDNNYVKFYMDNAYEYLNEKNVLLEEANMLNAEKYKNVGADMKTVNDGSLLDGLSENVSIPESEKVAGGLDKEAVDERKLYEIQDKIIENYFVANELKELGLLDDGLYEEITDYRFKEDIKQLRNPENQAKQYEAYMNILGREKEVGYINLPRVINDFKENNIKAVYNEENDNYDIISTRPNYKGEEYKILSCDKNGIVETNAYDMDLDLMSDYSNFYGYVQNLQALRSNEKYKNFDINCYGGYCDKMEIDLNNKDFNRKLVIENDAWNGMEDVQNKFVLEYPNDKEINSFNGIGSCYVNDLLVGRENGKLGEYMQFKDHDHITKTDYDVYFLKDKTDYQNVTKYIDDLVEDMDKISELKNKQDFINAVNSVTNKEHDQGLEQ